MSASVSERCRRCVSILKSISSAAVDQSEQNHHIIINHKEVEDNLERLSLWTGNIGALHGPQSSLSLESRLQDEKKVLDLILDLLEDLAEVAGELREIVTGDRQGEPEFAPADQDVGGYIDEETELLEEIRGCITRLFQISKLIRRAAPRDLFAKALSRDRYKFSDQFDIAYVGEKYPKLATEDLAWLRRRLGQAITQRRHYLSYIQDHRGKLEQVDSRDAKPESGTQQFTRQHQERQAGNTELHLASEPSTFVTKATSVQPGHITAEMLTVEDNSDPEDDSRSYTTISRSVDEDFEYSMADRIPRLDTLRHWSKDEVECPFCFRLKRFKNEKIWRRHVFSDLRAYVCTYPQCDGLYFGDINEWFSHEMETHRVQYACPLCPNKVFEHKKHYLAHIHKHHPTLLEHADKHLVLDMARQPLERIPAQDCPCCSDWVDRVRARAHPPPTSPDDTVCVVPTIFKRHLASHLEQLALFAIPLGSNVSEANSDDAIQTAADVPSQASNDSVLQFYSPNRSLASIDADGNEVRHGTSGVIQDAPASSHGKNAPSRASTGFATRDGTESPLDGEAIDYPVGGETDYHAGGLATDAIHLAGLGEAFAQEQVNAISDLHGDPRFVFRGLDPEYQVYPSEDWVVGSVGTPPTA
ncbi:uncharacterized protein F5Z01DRAFT_428247 [Emericellopsis atlantica]|uniref:C2H2-type domain-containing protein n=1 Tax=Emericellopsis atlantica TaxID=2614577 RepID=A0A9P8CLY4_9HYPO|nr:uncharacterized protein F5Z01DRAFT_428247 [Emericellopsis atlantica]KAG9250111.1 hypothetical protein F5Z01DRAFT_428247 [Emericellopsis atlantica]